MTRQRVKSRRARQRKYPLLNCSFDRSEPHVRLLRSKLQESSLSLYRDLLPVDLTRVNLAELGGDDRALAELDADDAGVFDLPVVLGLEMLLSY